MQLLGTQLPASPHRATLAGLPLPSHWSALDVARWGAKPDADEVSATPLLDRDFQAFLARLCGTRQSGNYIGPFAYDLGEIREGRPVDFWGPILRLVRYARRWRRRALA